MHTRCRLVVCHMAAMWLVKFAAYCHAVSPCHRIRPAVSSSVSRCTIYCVSQGPSSAVPVTARAVPAPSVRFALPVLYLPEAVVTELHEAARKIMLEQSRARWLQLQQDPAAVTDAASYLYYCMTDPATAGGNCSSSTGAYAETGVASQLSTQAGNKISGGANDSGCGGSRHWGSFSTQRSQHRAGPAARVSLFDDVEVPPELQQQQQQGQRCGHVQHSGSSGGPSGSGSSKQTFEEEDAEHCVSLRGRLFDGDDVHQLLQQQFLAVISDIGLLVDLAAAAAAGGATAAAAGVAVHSTEIAVTVGHGREPRRDPAPASPSEVIRIMASSVGQQLLLWASSLDCWSCCRQVLTLLLDIGIEVAMNDSIVTRHQVATVADVQDLLLGGRSPQPVASIPGSTTTATATTAATTVAGSMAGLHTSAAAAAKRPGSGGQSGGARATPNVVMPAQQQMHHVLEGCRSGAGSSESPVPCGDNASSMRRGRNPVDNNRARDQARAAAAAAIAGDMPGSAALGRKRCARRATASEAGSTGTNSGSGSPATLSRAASGRSAAAAGDTAHVAASVSEYGSASSVPPVPTLRSVGPITDEAAAPAIVTSAAPVDMESADMLAGQRERYKTQRRHRMSIKDSASEVFSRLMRRKSSSAGRKVGTVGDEIDVGQAAATVEP